MGTIIVTGPSGDNECCLCGYIEGDNPNQSRATGCPATCTDPVNLSMSRLYWWDIERDACMNYTCCPCPNTGDATRTASVTFAGCEGGPASVDITMSPGLGLAACTGGTLAGTDLGYERSLCYWLEDNSDCPYCYGTVPIDIRRQGYEKWAGSGWLCEDDSGGPGCSGQQIIVSTCCCGQIGANESYGGPLDCHTCNYSTTLTFVPNPHAGYYEDAYCTCPSGYDEYGTPPEHLLPGEEPTGPYHYSHYGSIEPQLINGECNDDGDLHTLVYKSSGLYFNCDCCSGGDQEGDNTIVLTITVT